MRMTQQNNIHGCCKQLSATQFELANRGTSSFDSQVSAPLWADLQGIICWIVFRCLALALGFAINSVILKASATKPRWSTTQRTGGLVLAPNLRIYSSGLDGGSRNCFTSLRHVLSASSSTNLLNVCSNSMFVSPSFGSTASIL